MRSALLLLATSVVLALSAGCGGDAGTNGETTAGGDETTVTLYFLRDGRVWPVRREVEKTGDLAQTAVDELATGPTSDEADDLGLGSALADDDFQDLESLDVAGGVAQASSAGELTREAEAQIVYTLDRLAEVESIELDGEVVTPADFEDQTPSVLVESPLAFQEASSPLTARGTANTFEATFSFEILDADGEMLAGDFVTATSGTGTRGTFRFEQPFVVEEEQDGTLVVFELSAEDGSRMNEVEIPLRLLP